MFKLFSPPKRILKIINAITSDNHFISMLKKAFIIIVTKNMNNL